MSNDLPRPQPIGVFPLPVGLLVIGPGDGHDEVRASLVAGKVPASFPPTLRFLEAAFTGDEEGALAALDGQTDPVALANRFVLVPDAAAFAHLQAVATGDLAVHVALAAFITGLAAAPPDPASTSGELAAMAHAALASMALAARDLDTAARELDLGAQAAIDACPPLAGQLLGQLANVHLDRGDAGKAAVTFEAALDALDDTDLAVSRAELHVSCGAMHQESAESAPRVLKLAIDHYQAALQLVDASTAPEIYGIAHANLGLAYLTMPMVQASDQLRVGVAVQSLREALTALTPELHPDRWASTTLNLANALVYLPSTHQADNIAESVRLYEEVLAHRDLHRDPLGRARVLANLGNALAHLGVLDEAKLRLHEARAILEEFEEHEMVRAVRSVLDEIAKQESFARQGRS